MYPLWDSVIEPVIRAAGGRRLVEIGALRGETTIRMLDALGPDSEVHVIDPVPEFDPSEHEEKFRGRYVFYRDLSLNVLPDAPPFDVALIDGDHNWYTVYNELRLLRETSRRAGEPLPVLILHDVLWPYGRRDLYYEPSQIPEEFRQPHARRGMRPDRKKLLPKGGMNVTLHNAETEGGRRNGVMTALDDFMAEHDRPLRRVVVPIYFGLAVVVEQELLDRRPGARSRARSTREPGRDARSARALGADPARRRRVRAQHRSRPQRAARPGAGPLPGPAPQLPARRPLHRQRGPHPVPARLLRRVAGRPSTEILPEPEGRAPQAIRPARASARRGPGRRRRRARSGFRVRRRRGATGCLRWQAPRPTMLTGRVTGDFVECATGRGGAGIYLRGCLEAHEDLDRQVWVADPFRASPPAGAAGGPARPGRRCGPT